MPFSRDKAIPGVLAGRIVFITGGARGMGRAHVEACVAAGANVIVADVLDDLGRDLVESLPPGRSLYIHCDVSQEQDWREALDRGLALFGAVHALVNNAGILLERKLLDTSLQEYSRVVSVNQTGCFLGMREVAPHIASAGGGSIVNISSVAGLVGFRDCFAYAASKHAIRGMTKSAALELADHSIRVNAIFPGDTQTPMIQDSETDAVADSESLPMRRYGKPEEIAATVVFLLSDASSFMTGAEIAVDGGYTAQ